MTHIHRKLGYLGLILCSIAMFPRSSQAEWQPSFVLNRLDPGSRNVLSPTVTPGPIDEDEQIALAQVLRWVPQELWHSSAMKVPLTRVPGTGVCGDEPAQSSASLYLLEYITLTYGIVVVQDMPNMLYSMWVESPHDSPLTGRKQIPLFFFSDRNNLDNMTALTPAKDFIGGPMEGLGDNGAGGLTADNGFSANGTGRAYWPLYLRGFLTRGGMIPYAILPFGNSVRNVLSVEDQSRIPFQTYNYTHTPSDTIIKIACHADGALHGWVPGDPGQFEVRFELSAQTIQNNFTRQTRKMMEENRFTSGYTWPVRGQPLPAPSEIEPICSIDQPTPSPSPGITINAGGGDYTTQTGVVYQSDAGLTTARSYTPNPLPPISGTVEDGLYQTERWAGGAGFSYNLPMADGAYVVTLRFAELFYNSAAARVFDVVIENGQETIADIDVFAEVGADAAFDMEVPVTVSGGSLDIDFVPVVREAMVMAIDVRPI